MLSPGLPISILVVLSFITARNSPSHVYEEHVVLFVLSYGFACAKITCRLVVGTVPCLISRLVHVVFVKSVFEYG